MYSLSSQRILYTFMSNFFRIQVLGLVIGQIAFAKSLELSTKLIYVVDFITSQPLRSSIVLDQKFFIHFNFMPQRIESILRIGMLKNPDTVRIKLGGNWDLLLSAEFRAAHRGDGDALQV